MKLLQGDGERPWKHIQVGQDVLKQKFKPKPTLDPGPSHQLHASDLQDFRPTTRILCFSQLENIPTKCQSCMSLWHKNTEMLKKENSL